MILNLIGDLHGQYTLYTKLVKRLPAEEYSLQIGDFGFSYGVLNAVDHNNHKMFFGNHDNYDLFHTVPSNLGHFGVWKDIFFVRGAWSIDRKYRMLGIDWWEKEELAYSELNDASLLYFREKPSIMVTHEAPLSVVEYVTDPSVAKDFGYDGVIKTKTNQSLQSMLDGHRPKLWVFGHYHTMWSKEIDGTNFICLNSYPNKGSVLRIDTRHW